jgi:hypothetical protein
MNILDEAEQRGIERGISRGISQGISQSISQGIEKERRETIIRSWKNGIAIPMISNITSASIAEVEKVIADFQKAATI